MAMALDATDTAHLAQAQMSHLSGGEFQRDVGACYFARTGISGA